MFTDACTLVNLTPRSFYTTGNDRSRTQDNTAASRSHYSFFMIVPQSHGITKNTEQRSRNGTFLLDSAIMERENRYRKLGRYS